MSNNNDFENRMHFMLKNNNGKPFSEKKYPKGQHVGFLNEEFGNYSTECDKLIVYQRNLIQQQQCLIDILSVKLGKCEKSDSEEQDLNLSKQKQIIRIFVSISFALLVTIGVVVLILHYTNSALKDNSDFTTTVPSSKDNENLGTHQVLDRTQWNGRAALSVENMTSPVPIVIIKHTGGGPCLTFQECAGKVQTIQSNSVTDGLSDIRYSFLIGGDGNIYVGRGWNVQPAQIPDTIDIAFMGSFSFDLLSDTMIEAAQLLLKDGVEREKLDKEYKLVSHNQTTSTESPGKNVYELITKWPHYDGQLKIGWRQKGLIWHNTPPKSKSTWYKNKYVIIIGGTLILTISAIIVFVILYNTSEDEDDVERLGDHRVYNRRHWGAQPPRATVDLVHPTTFVIISHSVSPWCDSFSSCSGLVRSFQNHHFTLGNYDVGYNFIIGGDANIYVGRGWDVRNFHNSISIGICFIGDFRSDELNDGMISAAKLLIEQGFNAGKISTEYILVGQNQTDRGLPESPGENVYRVIKSWPHFSGESYFD
ncbi:uncharacterized protein LOC108914271 isoform X1 [Anoplophora glabripennis]|uniref:uncharacterized protein LOC108914271 isoform X1 n=1 Tax=Anoplophora glabripennis TaxID=217634 RepID=UPI00087373FD|nr:uncharacterized protein LOC108914271 isoform X1 [Anoplophora glabripennis]